MERRVIVELNNKLLVSVPVITYNSSKFVLETLESIKAQTYQNIELIISDDCSTDNTVDLCQKWVEENKDRFVRTQIITSETNTGVSANLNRAEDACHGDWVKGIAGDDLLTPNCIEDFLMYVQQNPDHYFLFGNIEGINENGESISNCLDKFLDKSFFDLTAVEQYERLVMKGNCIAAPTFFYNHSMKKQLGIINDETIPLCEDYPKWIQITSKGQKLYLLDKCVVKYRIHSTSVSNKDDSVLFKRSQALAYLKYRYKYQLAEMPSQAIFRYLCVKKFLTNKNYYSVPIFLYRVMNRIYRSISRCNLIDIKFHSYFKS